MGSHAIEHPRLLPGMLLPDPDADRARRSARDWFVDVTAFLLALGFGALLWMEEAATGDAPDGLLAADAAYGFALCCLLWVRRRWPLGVAIAAIPAAAFSATGGGAACIALFSLAVHRRWPAAFAVAAAQIALTPIYFALYPDEGVPTWVMLMVMFCVTATIVAWGMFVRARRQLVLSLHERAARAESEQQLRVDQARQAERARIAREMHDVLAHRISLVSLHAGALEFRPDAPPGDVARAAAIVRTSAHQALADLRDVIGVLRDTHGHDAPEPPQPTLADLPALLDESRAAGMRLSADVRLDALGDVPPRIGRSALRIVQEALTNARKHAPDARVTLLVEGAPGDGLDVVVRNPAPLAVAPAGPAIPGAGTGLVGLGERAALAGGTLEHGFEPDGGFVLRAWLPWPA